MGRWSVLIVFALLALVGAVEPPKHQLRTVGAQAPSNEEKAADTVARAIRDSAQPTSEDKGCKDRRDKRDSELCAQWKAADAAYDAADYAFWALLISAAGTGLLVWTLWETRANARRELRAYVSVKVAGLDVERCKSGHLKLVLHTTAHNGGSTPAYKCNHFGYIAAMTDEEAFERLKTVRPILSQSDASGSVIHSGDNFTARMTNSPAIGVEKIAGIKVGEVKLFAFGVTSYVDTFGRRRRTDFCYIMEGQSFVQSIGDSEKSPGEKVTTEWVVAPFHNSAT